MNPSLSYLRYYLINLKKILNFRFEDYACDAFIAFYEIYPKKKYIYIYKNNRKQAKIMENK